MPVTERLEDGRLVVLGEAGWRAATPEEEMALETPAVDAWSMQFVGNLGKWAGLAGGLLSANVRLHGGTDTGNPLSRFSTETASRLAPLEEMQPARTAAGSFWTDPANLAGLTGTAGQVARGVLSRRVAQRVTAAGNAARAAGNAAREAGGTGGASVPGMDSVGAAATTDSLVSRNIRNPGELFAGIRQSVDEFLSPERLTPDQVEMLPVGRRLGFRFLPGQARGAKGIRELAGSDPLVAGAFAPELEANRRGLRAAAAKAIGLGQDDFSRNLLGVAADKADEAFSGVAEKIGTVQVPADLRGGIELVRKTEPFLVFPEDGTLTGRQFLALRSSLNRASQTAWAAGANAPAGKAEYLDELVMQLDDLAEGALSESDQLAWRLARERWKNLKVLESPNVVNELGDINHRSLSTALRRYYKGAYGRQVTGEAGRRAGLSAETQTFMDWSRLANQFADNFPNSGTAYRGRLVQVMTNPKELAKSVLLRQAVVSRLGE